MRLSLLAKYNFLISIVMAGIGGFGGGGGGIISAAMELIKEKERQGDKAMDRLHDGMKTQMEMTANQGSWTGGATPSRTVKEKETVKEKVKEPEEKKEESAPKMPTSTGKPDTDPTPDGSPAEETHKKDPSSMGIIAMAKGAS